MYIVLALIGWSRRAQFLQNATPAMLFEDQSGRQFFQKVTRAMKAQDFLAWMATVKARYAADVVELLDVNRNTVQEWVAMAKNGDDVPVKRSVALAMSAVAQGLKPWDEYAR